MGLKTYLPPDVVDFDELKAWRSKIKLERDPNCPKEVDQFIEAIAEKMRDFERYKVEHVKISGAELVLSGMKEINGETVYPWYFYDLPVPVMQAVDHRAWMHRMYKRRGKTGLIEYIKFHVKGSELEKTLDVLNTHVFKLKQDSPAFQQAMAEINASKKLESHIDV